jgi:hypothetical protein
MGRFPGLLPSGALQEELYDWVSKAAIEDYEAAPYYGPWHQR